MQISRCLLTHANAPPSLWSYALLHATLVYNLYPHSLRPDVTSTELWTRSKPAQGGKFAPKKQICVYLGHNLDNPNYLFLNHLTNQPIRSRNVVFNETRPFYTSSPSSLPCPPLVWAKFDPSPSPTLASSPTPSSPAASPSTLSNPPSPSLTSEPPTSSPPKSAPLLPFVPPSSLTPPPSTSTPSTSAPPLITYRHCRHVPSYVDVPPPSPPPPSSPIAHHTRSHGQPPPLSLSIRLLLPEVCPCLVFLKTGMRS
ncbi:unnamed protein product [Closterium sp. NIES-54]